MLSYQYFSYTYYFDILLLLCPSYIFILEYLIQDTTFKPSVDKLYIYLLFFFFFFKVIIFFVADCKQQFRAYTYFFIVLNILVSNCIPERSIDTVFLVTYQQLPILLQSDRYINNPSNKLSNYLFCPVIHNPRPLHNSLNSNINSTMTLYLTTSEFSFMEHCAQHIVTSAATCSAAHSILGTQTAVQWTVATYYNSTHANTFPGHGNNQSL